MKKCTVIFLGLFFSFSIFANVSRLRDITFLPHQPGIDINFLVSGKLNYHTFTLQNPTRFIIDFNHTAVSLTQLKKLTQNIPTSSPINTIRYSNNANHTTRLVFDLKNETIPKIKALKNNFTGDTKLQLRFMPTPIGMQKIRTFLPKLSKKNLRDVIIVIDPGHGGKDPGAISRRRNVKEKNIVLAISKSLRNWINKQPGFRAVLTRDGDYYLSLRERLRIARQDHADMFVAIHADTWRNNNARGVSVFALSQRGATSEAARWLAQRENASELMGGVGLQDKSNLLKSVLINLSQSATIRSSLLIGDAVIRHVQSIARLHHNRVEQAAFVVLKSPDIPSLLVETGFLSNPSEVTRLQNKSYQDQIAHAMMRGIRQYFAYTPPRGTRLSYWKEHPVTS